jgi:hypothetical protein
MLAERSERPSDRLFEPPVTTLRASRRNRQAALHSRKNPQACTRRVDASPRCERVPGDTLFAIGALGFVVFVFGLGLGYSLEAKGRPAAGPADRPARQPRAPEPTVNA